MTSKIKVMLSWLLPAVGAGSDLFGQQIYRRHSSATVHKYPTNWLYHKKSKIKIQSIHNGASYIDPLLLIKTWEASSSGGSTHSSSSSILLRLDTTYIAKVQVQVCSHRNKSILCSYCSAGETWPRTHQQKKQSGGWTWLLQADLPVWQQPEWPKPPHEPNTEDSHLAL